MRSDVQQVGLDGHGSIDVPQPGPHYDEAAWFTGSPAPGQSGSSTIVGHIDSAKNGPSVFFKLGALGKGDHVTVKRQDGKAVTFTVYRIERYHKDAFPTQAVYGNTSGPELRLITCGGSFDSGTGHYVDNIVVYARLARRRRSPGAGSGGSASRVPVGVPSVEVRAERRRITAAGTPEPRSRAWC